MHLKTIPNSSFSWATIKPCDFIMGANMRPYFVNLHICKFHCRMSFPIFLKKVKYDLKIKKKKPLCFRYYVKVTLHSRMSREKYRCHIAWGCFYLITVSGTPARLLVYLSEMRHNQNYKLLPVMEFHGHMRMLKTIHVKSMNESIIFPYDLKKTFSKVFQVQKLLD